MSARNRIVVLDDDAYRIEWLERVVAGTGVLVEWHTTVHALVEALGASPDGVKLVILDHDLGPHSQTSEDENGDTGMTAARMIPIALHRVLVWSNNTERRVAMCDMLLSRGFDAISFAFERAHLWELRERIIRWVM